MSKPSRYRMHVVEWEDCCRCPLHAVRTKVVLCRGTVPCDVLFVGEAPGVGEDVVGQPFVGPAGRLLDQIVFRATEPYDRYAAETNVPTLKTAFTNVIACIPKGGRHEAKVKEAKDWDVKWVEACKPRLQEFIDLARPRLVVAVGKIAAEWTEPHDRANVKLPPGCKRCKIEHPASILRKSEADRGLSVQRCVVTLKDALGDL